MTNILVFVSILISFTIASSQEEPYRCTMCHTQGGAGNNKYLPRIAGQMEKYFISEMKAYRNHSRASEDAKNYMWKYSEFLNDDDITNLARWFGAQKPAPGIKGNPKIIEKGKDIYVNGIPEREIDDCISCHGNNGAGKGKYPRLAGQMVYYQVTQMQEYAKGTIKNAKWMPEIARQLTDDETYAVSLYLQSL